VKSFRKVTILAVVSLATLLSVGVATASAHGRPGRGAGAGSRGISVSALITQSAKELGITRADLKEAIVDSANTSIDEAVQDEDLTADEADALREDAADNLRVAYSLSRTRTVAANLGITTAKLNSGFRAARKALLLAKIDKAVANGDLTEEEAAARKEALASASLPGYKPAGRAFSVDAAIGGGCNPGR
jgi:polyhydroxyalkanoate synthesis regulator phasin